MNTDPEAINILHAALLLINRLIYSLSQRETDKLPDYINQYDKLLHRTKALKP